MVKHKRSGTAASLPGGLVIGLGTSILITLIGCAAMSYMITQEKVEFNSIGYCTMCILSVSSITGSLLAAKSVKSKTAVVCALFALCYFLLLLAITAMFFGGQYQGIGATAITVLIGALCGMLLMVSGKHKRKNVRKITGYR